MTILTPGSAARPAGDIPGQDARLTPLTPFRQRNQEYG
jgi:hypothetical protein